MSSRLTRAGVLLAIAAAFGGGVLFASGLDLPPLSHAQQTAKPSTQAVRPLAEASNAFVAIAEAVTPAVVSIQMERDQAPPRARSRNFRVPPGFEEFFDQFDRQGQPGRQQATGSGFIVRRDGYILTNNHVVEGADRVEVRLTDHRVFKARVVGRDPTTDVAVIKIEGTNLPTVALGDDGSVRVGESVLAIGNPLGLDFTVTAGIVSAKGRGATALQGLMRDRYAISDFIQTDAAINPGNSGGPLVNIRGEVIGINNSIASPTGFYTGYGFAIPITLAKDVMEDLIEHGRVRRAVLGVGVDEVDPDDAAVAGLKRIEGVQVTNFAGVEDSPARRAGIEQNDVIIAIDGRPVDRVSTLQRIVRSHEPGETVEVTLMRYGQQKTVRIKLAEAPTPSTPAVATADVERADGGVSAGKLGISVEAVTPEVVRQFNLDESLRGLRVTAVRSGGPADDKLFANIDVLVEVLHPAPRTALRTPADLQRVLERLKRGDYVTLSVARPVPNGSPVLRVENVRIGG